MNCHQLVSKPLCLMLDLSMCKICHNTGSIGPTFSRIRREFQILFLYWKIRFRENMYSGIIYASFSDNGISHMDESQSIFKIRKQPLLITHVYDCLQQIQVQLHISYNFLLMQVLNNTLTVVHQLLENSTTWVSRDSASTIIKNVESFE